MSIGTILYTLLIGPLKLLFEVIFSYANALTHSPGLSIFVLSLAINLLVLPLYKRSDALQEEERDMQAKLQKGVAHIKKVFKGDERMLILQTYYRQNQYKPLYVLRGATSLLLEIPFFLAAYSFLSNLAMLSGVSLGPIADLGKPDGLITVFGLRVNLLPIVMTLVNFVSSAIFTKDYPAKTKVQLYGMAVFFLVFLYDSSSGLVFYWILNNVFSLIKNIFYRLKRSKKAVFAAKSLGRKDICCPGGKSREWVPNSRLFLCAALFLAALSGALIPSSVIEASPLEFVSDASFYHPLWYLVNSACLAFGSCVIWFGVFYWLAPPKGKVIFERVLCVLCGAAIVDYLFFGKNLGILTPALQYEQGMAFERAEVLINAAVVTAVAAGMYLISTKWRKAACEILLVGSLAVLGMSAINIVSIDHVVDAYMSTQSDGKDEIQISLSKKGKNVIVLMLDRAAGHMVPYIMNEKPELKEQFTGFTYYSNVVSFGRNTNFASPALYGGYEYTPLELNKRDTESLCDKQNEALKVMPVMFLNEEYDVTVFDPTYANYQWIPDLSIYEEYPEIKTAITMGAFNGALRKDSEEAANPAKRNRNFFCFAVMKAAPLCIQKSLYEYGNYHHLTELSELVESDDFDSYPTDSFQMEETPYKAVGLYSAFLDAYTVLTHLSDITKITNDDRNSFLMMSNDTTHNGTMLQEPEYVPAEVVDNTAYEEAHADRFTLDGTTLHLEDSISIQHYQINMAAFLQLGKWFDYLRENGVYDNTRIILVSDHNAGIEDMEELSVPIEGQENLNITGFFPLLMVKNFGSHQEFTTSGEFMTNADVPTLASSGLIGQPVNPFTGKTIDSSAKTAEKMYLFAGRQWDTTKNNGNTFLPDYWYSVHDDLWNPDNWAAEGYGVLPNQ